MTSGRLRRIFVLASLVLLTTACGTAAGNAVTPILLFSGKGTSPNDVEAVEKILSRAGLDYSTADSAQLNGMAKPQIRQHRLLIVPGGNFEQIGNSHTSAATANVRTAVRNGLNYLGICAGAFLAGNSPYNGLNLTSGVRFGFYAAEARGIRKQAVPITVAGAPILDHYWEDGPQFTGWGTVIGKYPDGTPAIVEGTFGTGWIVLTGVHPEAPAGWRRGLTFTTPTEADNAYAETLIRAALNRMSLAHH